MAVELDALGLAGAHIAAGTDRNECLVISRIPPVEAGGVAFVPVVREVARMRETGYVCCKDCSAGVSLLVVRDHQTDRQHRDLVHVGVTARIDRDLAVASERLNINILGAIGTVAGTAVVIVGSLIRHGRTAADPSAGVGVVGRRLEIAGDQDRGVRRRTARAAAGDRHEAFGRGDRRISVAVGVIAVDAGHEADTAGPCVFTARVLSFRSAGDRHRIRLVDVRVGQRRLAQTVLGVGERRLPLDEAAGRARSERRAVARGDLDRLRGVRASAVA